MSAHRRLAAVGATAALALIGTGSAFAATPQQIYRDLADNARLDGKYTPAELQRAFKATPPALARKPIGVPREGGPVQATSRRDENRPLPFTALDAALLAAGGGPVLLIAARLRRRMAPRATEAPVVSG